jgi:hypothetical protein
VPIGCRQTDQGLTKRDIFVTNGEAVLSPTGDCEISDT